MLQMVVVGMSGRSLRLPTRIRSICVDPLMHLEKVSKYTDDKQGVFVFHLFFFSCLLFLLILLLIIYAGRYWSTDVCCWIWLESYFVTSHFCLFSIAIDVHVNRCLDNIVAGGVQICGLHATVAPRRQQQQSPPVLEEFVFVPYVETKCLTANGKLAEKLRLCKGTTIIPSVVLIVLSVFMSLIFQPHQFDLYFKHLKLNISCTFFNGQMFLKIVVFIQVWSTNLNKN